MSTETPATNPFLHTQVDGQWYGATAAEDRTRMLQNFSHEQCNRALTLPDLQKTVVRALQSRLRKLNGGKS